MGLTEGVKTAELLENPQSQSSKGRLPVLSSGTKQLDPLLEVVPLLECRRYTNDLL